MKGYLATALAASLLAACGAPATPPAAAAIVEAEPDAAMAAAPEPAPEPAPVPAPSPLRAKVFSEMLPNLRVVTFLSLQATVDEVTLDSASLNRGNCQTFPFTSRGNLPVTLRYGEEVRIEMKNCGDLLEASAMTSLGEVAFEFSPETL